MTVHVCLNMIVRNEAKIIPRLLNSLTDRINSFCILDTGSTDGTPDLIKQWAITNQIRGEVFRGPFNDFSDARNRALAYARQTRFDWDYLLLLDADHEFRVSDNNTGLN
jgi:glycosyltransferase involved in cell wall biosynthesis